MAFTRAATSDTDPKVQTRAYGSLRPPRGITPLTGRTATSGRLRTGRSNLTFSSTNVPQPARTAPPPDVASEGPRITGEQGSTGNPIGDAIGNAAKKLSPLIADAFSTPDNRQAAINLVDATESPLSNPGSFISAPASAPAPASFPIPVAAPAPAFPISFNEGGFIRKRT